MATATPTNTQPVSTPFGAMAQERRDTLSQIADIAGKAADIASIIGSPAGSRVQVKPPIGTTPGGNFPGKEVLTNPLVIAGAIVAGVVVVRAVGRRRRRR